MNEKWKQYLGLLPIISFLAMGFGYLHLHIFYSQIGVGIFSYITTSEIFLAFVPYLPFITVIAVATSVALAFINALENHFDNQIVKMPNKYLRIFLHIITFVIIGILYSFYLFLPGMTDPKIQFLSALGFLILISVILFFSKDVKSNFKIIRIDYIITFSYLVILTWFNGYNRSKKIILENSPEFEIKTAEYKYNNTEFIYYGRTKDYTFLVRSNDTTTFIINNKLVTSEKLKK